VRFFFFFFFFFFLSSLCEFASAANPFHGSGAVQSPRALLNTDCEPCHLTPEETLYLAHVEQCLRIEPAMSSPELWSYFSQHHERFALLYFVYQHYRQLGWVVRAGSKMGVDWVLYQDHPGAVHAQHSVIVQEQSEAMSWPELLGIGRVSENVRKTLVLCRVELAKEETDIDELVGKSSVLEELVYRRWATNRTRDGNGEDEPDWSGD
jgi:tRNA-splicing endonuclease subunit Sen2